MFIAVCHIAQKIGEISVYFPENSSNCKKI